MRCKYLGRISILNWYFSTKNLFALPSVIEYRAWSSVNIAPNIIQDWFQNPQSLLIIVSVIML